MRTMTQAVVLATADPNGICLTQTPAAGGEQILTINGALTDSGVATIDVARHVEVTSVGNDTARSFTFVGTDRKGDTLIEVITGGNAAAVNGTKNFKTVIFISVDDDTAAAITVGTNDSADGAWIPLDTYQQDFKVNIAGSITTGASLTFGIEQTLDDVFADGFMEDDAVVFVHGTIAGETAAVNGTIITPVAAVRLAVTGYTSGTVTAQIKQSGW